MQTNQLARHQYCKPKLCAQFLYMFTMWEFRRKLRLRGNSDANSDCCQELLIRAY